MGQVLSDHETQQFLAVKLATARGSLLEVLHFETTNSLTEELIQVNRVNRTPRPCTTCITPMTKFTGIDMALWLLK